MTKKINNPIYYSVKITDAKGNKLDEDDLSSSEKEIICDNPFEDCIFREEENEE